MDLTPTNITTDTYTFSDDLTDLSEVTPIPRFNVSAQPTGRRGRRAVRSLDPDLEDTDNAPTPAAAPAINVVGPSGGSTTASIGQREHAAPSVSFSVPTSVPVAVSAPAAAVAQQRPITPPFVPPQSAYTAPPAAPAAIAALPMGAAVVDERLVKQMEAERLQLQTALADVKMVVSQLRRALDASEADRDRVRTDAQVAIAAAERRSAAAEQRAAAAEQRAIAAEQRAQAADDRADVAAAAAEQQRLSRHADTERAQVQATISDLKGVVAELRHALHVSEAERERLQHDVVAAQQASVALAEQKAQAATARSDAARNLAVAQEASEAVDRQRRELRAMQEAFDAERRAFYEEVEQLRDVGTHMQQKSRDVAAAMQAVSEEKRHAQAILDDAAQHRKLALEAEQRMEQAKHQLLVQQKLFEQERLEMIREKRDLTAQKEEASRAIHDSRLLQSQTMLLQAQVSALESPYRFQSSQRSTTPTLRSSSGGLGRPSHAVYNIRYAASTGSTGSTAGLSASSMNMRVPSLSAAAAQSPMRPVGPVVGGAGAAAAAVSDSARKALQASFAPLLSVSATTGTATPSRVLSASGGTPSRVLSTTGLTGTSVAELSSSLHSVGVGSAGSPLATVTPRRVQFAAPHTLSGSQHSGSSGSATLRTLASTTSPAVGISTPARTGHSSLQDMPSLALTLSASKDTSGVGHGSGATDSSLGMLSGPSGVDLSAASTAGRSEPAVSMEVSSLS